jgi:hypothetical protein
MNVKRLEEIDKKIKKYENIETLLQDHPHHPVDDDAQVNGEQPALEQPNNDA